MERSSSVATHVSTTLTVSLACATTCGEEAHRQGGLGAEATAWPGQRAHSQQGGQVKGTAEAWVAAGLTREAAPSNPTAQLLLDHPCTTPLQLAFMKFLSMFWKRLASCGSCFTMSPPLNTASMYIHMF